jgi:hypothetical protein
MSGGVWRDFGRRASIAAAFAALALVTAACNEEAAAPQAPTPSVSSEPETLAEITSVGVAPETVLADHPYAVIVTYHPGSVSSLIPCEIMLRGGRGITKWSFATETEEGSSGASHEFTYTYGLSYPDAGRLMVECSSPADGGDHTAYFDVVFPDETQAPVEGSATPAPPAPEATPTPTLEESPAATAEPTPAASFAFSGYGSGDLTFDLASSTSDNPAYPQPDAGCWPVSYHAGPIESLTVSSLGKIAGGCLVQEGAAGPGAVHRAGGLEGALDPATGTIDFTFSAETSIENKLNVVHGINSSEPTIYGVKFKTAAGKMVSATEARGTAEWEATCQPGAGMCSPVPSAAAGFSATGTISWTLTLRP